MINPFRLLAGALERATDALDDATHATQSSPGLVATCGAVLIALVGGVVAVVVMSFGGAFASYQSVSADIPASGSAVALNSPVEYRDVEVGTVATGARRVAGGAYQVVLHLLPGRLRTIPAGVQATTEPISIFGNEYVVLVPGAPGGGSLRAGATIPAVTAGSPASVQTTLSDLDYLLVQAHPAQLTAALNAVARALQGNGQSLGVTLDRFNSYLTAMLPLWPKVESDLGLLAPAAEGVARSVPDVLGTVSNFSATSATVEANQLAINQILAGGISFAGQFSSVLANVQEPYAELVAAAGPFLQSVAQTPTTVGQLLEGLDSWARTWTAAEAQGPYLTLSASVPVDNPADLALSALGAPDTPALLSGALGPGSVNPPTYTSADCARYGTLAGANCGGSAPSASVASVAIMPEPAQQDALSTVAAALGGGRPLPSPAVATLLLSPVLAHVAEEGR